MLVYRACQRIGRRGAFLVTVGLLQVITGWATIEAPPQSVQFLSLARVAPLWVLGAIQIALAAVAILYAFGAPGKDGYGFMAAYAMPMYWGLAYLTAILNGQMVSGALAGVRALAFWWGYAVLILLASGMVGVNELHALRGESEVGKHGR